MEVGEEDSRLLLTCLSGLRALFVDVLYVCTRSFLTYVVALVCGRCVMRYSRTRLICVDLERDS